MPKKQILKTKEKQYEEIEIKTEKEWIHILNSQKEKLKFQ